MSFGLRNIARDIYIGNYRSMRWLAVIHPIRNERRSAANGRFVRRAVIQTAR